MPAVALSRVGARVVESGPGGQDLAAGAWERLESLQDPRSPEGRIYPLACLVAIAICAFTAAGNDRFTAVGQWIRPAGQADLARLRARGTRAPDDKTIRVVLDRLDPRAQRPFPVRGLSNRIAYTPGPPDRSRPAQPGLVVTA